MTLRYIDDMKCSARGSILGVLVLILSMTLPHAHSSSPKYESLEYTNDEVLFLGDILKIDAGWCWPSKKPTQSLAKKRLEIYKSGRWQSVGKVVYPKSADCPTKTPYLQQFQWEVDELGIMNPDQISGKLRLRNSAVKPTIYSKVSVFESELAYEAKLKADEEADKKASAENVGRYAEIFNCFIKGGEWNSAGNYCVVP
jgi:hypothetical protein